MIRHIGLTLDIPPQVIALALTIIENGGLFALCMLLFLWRSPQFYREIARSVNDRKRIHLSHERSMLKINNNKNTTK